MTNKASLPELDNLVLAVTPTQNRQDYLERQYTVFLEAYRQARAQSPSMPDLKWVIVDTSAKPSEFYTKLQDPDVLYMHIPDRNDLSTVPAEYHDMVADRIYSNDELSRRVVEIQTQICDRVKTPDNVIAPTIGEQRNIAVEAGARKFASSGKDFTIFTKDDDDFSAPGLVADIHNAMQDAVFVKPARCLIYHKPLDRWYDYDITLQHEPALAVENGEMKHLDRYIVWNDKAETQESEYGQLEMLGTLFSYRHSAFEAVSKARQATGELPGGFEPVRWREDHLFARNVFGEFGTDQVAIVDNDVHSFGRLVERNTAKTICHGAIDHDDVPAHTASSIYFISSTKSFEECNQDNRARLHQIFALNANVESEGAGKHRRINIATKPNPGGGDTGGAAPAGFNPA